MTKSQAVVILTETEDNRLCVSSFGDGECEKIADQLVAILRACFENGEAIEKVFTEKTNTP